MNNNRSSLIWGIALIAAGAIFLASNYGFLPDWNNNPQFWMITLLAASGLCLLTFALQGPRAWGWLFPASICAGQAATIYLATTLVNSPVIAFPVMISVALPFLIGYLLDRSRTGLLIPAWIIAGVAGMMFIVENVKGEIIPLYVMMVVALPFLFIGLTNPQRRAMLIPGGVLALVGLFPVVVSSLNNDLVPVFILGLIGLPFVVTAAWSRKNWWAIIPAGVLISIAGALFFSGVTRGTDVNPNDAKAAILVWTMFLGFALTFGLLWLLRGAAPTAWAVYPAVGLALISLISFAFGADAANLLWPVAIIAAGLFSLYRALRPTKQL